MNPSLADLENAVSLQGMLGYLNFASGKPDPRFQKQLSDAYGVLAGRGADEPWKVLHSLFRSKLAVLKSGPGSAFRDAAQGEAVLHLVFNRFLPAYREHHADLLCHLTDQELLQPFFLARACEAVLSQGPPWEDEERIVAGALTQLNDFVGHRPLAILQTCPKGEPYDHERVRPVPLFIRGAGVAWGRYHDLIDQALEILAQTDRAILAEAGLELDLLDELAFDPRAYDQGHPVNRRPNYVFGEWDPHHLDSQGRYRRYVARQLTLDALLDRMDHAGQLDPQEVLWEGAAVLAGTILMASGMTGASPAAHDSSVTLATLMPRIAQYRDAFYTFWLSKVTGLHAQRLRQEAELTRQPFGGARQHLNQYMGRHRALQLQQRQLAILFAEMGYPEASREAAARIPAVSVRMLSAIVSRLNTGQVLADRGDLAGAAQLLPQVEELLQRGIACGALVDPWNVLGFQGFFPLFPSRDDSIHDPRVAELLSVIELIFNLYAQLLGESAGAGDRALSRSLLANLKRLAGWWDRFATAEVSDIQPMRGDETVASAEHVAAALAGWREQGETAGDLAFWRQHLEGFQSPKAFALVVDTLLRKADYRAAMALLMNWLALVEHVPLEDGEYSFHFLALRWMLAWTGHGESRDKAAHEPASPSRPNAWPLVKKFLDYLEANAEDYWQVPVLDVPQASADESKEDEDGSLYSAAYAGVTYRDSADDNQESAVADDAAPQDAFDLEIEGESIAARLHFLSTVARLWQISARHDFAAVARLSQPGDTGKAEHTETLVALDQEKQETVCGWLATAQKNQQQLLALLDAIHAYHIPEPLGSFDSLVEFDRRRYSKEQLLYTAISTCLDTYMAIGTLHGTLPHEDAHQPEWELPAIQLEQSLVRGDAGLIRHILPVFLERFQHERLLFTSLADGGQPREILRVRLAQTVLRALVSNLPRLGLLRETFLLLKTARAMEQAKPPPGRGVTEFSQLFQAGYQAVMEAVVDSASTRPPARSADQELVDVLETISWPFMSLWLEHSQTLQLSALETLGSAEEAQALRQFVQVYGSDFFQPKFMTQANLRSILHHGVAAYLDYLRDNPDPLHPVRLLDDLGHKVRREDALRWLGCILQTIVENYEEYKDYNTTTSQSDYGQNLYLLLDFLALKASYERQAWQAQPVLLAHQVLVRKGCHGAALLWQQAFAAITQEWANEHLEKLKELEQAHGIQLRTVSDRLQERFVRPLVVEQLCALVEPAMEEARHSARPSSFQRLRQELAALVATPSGVGLDVPAWLRQLEQEVQRVRLERTALAALAEDFFQVPRIIVPFAELRADLKHWAEDSKNP